ncbi:hypothetical protein ACS0TY_032730 [Phlomoides rotata]
MKINTNKFITKKRRYFDKAGVCAMHGKQALDPKFYKQMIIMSTMYIYYLLDIVTK